MKEQQGQHSVAKMARIAGVSRSGYYAWARRTASRHEQEDQELAGLIAKIFNGHRKRYGSPRIWEELKGLGRRISRKRVERLMRKQNLYARLRRKWVPTTDSGHQLAVAEHILARNFHSDVPGEKWVSDSTYLPTSTGWLYLTIILDLWDRKIIGWSMGEGLQAEYTCRALDMAVRNRPPREGLIFHSDRGVQYCSERFRTMLAQRCPSVRQSMSRKGNCWDNACAESFFKTLKTELEELSERRRYSAQQIKTLVFEYIELYYNRCRRHSTLGYAIPVALTPNNAA